MVPKPFILDVQIGCTTRCFSCLFPHFQFGGSWRGEGETNKGRGDKHGANRWKDIDRGRTTEKQLNTKTAKAKKNQNKKTRVCKTWQKIG